jgi:O-antigen biosynthesis protein
MFNDTDGKQPPVSSASGEPTPSPAVTAPASKPAPAAQVSIVIPCCGQLEYTRLCVPSLLRHSRRAAEIIFLNIGSFDGTAEYLDGVAAASPLRVEVLHAASETAFQRACLEGLAHAHGSHVVWLSNDTIVTEGWLELLLLLASIHPTIGVVGPMSNYAPEKQRVSPVPYRLRIRPGNHRAIDPAKTLPDFVAMERFAKELSEQNKGKWEGVDQLGGFCMLIKREVFQKVPMFDEKWEAGVFNADAFGWKVRQAGYRLALCRDLFMHHFGSRVAAT